MRKSTQQKRAGRLERIRQHGRRLQIPTPVTVRVLARQLTEKEVADHPLREQWHAEYHEENSVMSGSDKTAQAALQKRQAGQIAADFTVAARDAYAVLDGRKTSGELANLAMHYRAAQRRLEQEGQAESKRRWVAEGIAILRERDLPEEMARAAANSAFLGLSSRPPGLLPSPVEIILRFWEQRLDQSAFASAGELIAAWQECQAWTAENFHRAQERRLREAHAGMLPDHIARLCAPDHIEQTLQILFHVNHWAKARERLLYNDRQGLYRVKAVLLECAWRNSLIQATACVDGSSAFCPFAHVITDCALEWFADLLRESFIKGNREKDSWDRFYLIARQLYRRATGREATAAEADAPDLEAVEQYIRRRLEKLQAHALVARTPIPPGELEALLLSTDDVLEGSWRFTPAWDELDETDLGVLDPEWRSLIALRYQSPAASFTFHLPFRVAGKFIPAETLRRLQGNGTQREAGEFFGREISEAESLTHPVRELLAKLGVDVDLVCPQDLVDKNDYLLEKAITHLGYHEVEEWEDDWGEDDWDE